MFAQTQGKIPTSYRSTILKLLLVVAAFIGVKLTDVYPEKYTATTEFLEHSFFYRMFYILLAVEIGFSKYYFAWSMGEAGANVVGISFNGFDANGQAKWDRLIMMRLWDFKLSQNARGIVDNWNIPCQSWLKYYVFLRLVKVFPTQTAKTLTFVTSAIWHGFYPGYYLFFMSGAMLEPLTNLLRANLRWRFLNADGSPKSTKFLYDIGGWMITFWTIDYLTLGFRLLAFQPAIAGWSSIYFHTHIISVVLLTYFTFFGVKTKPPSKEAKNTQ